MFFTASKSDYKWLKYQYTRISGPYGLPDFNLSIFALIASQSKNEKSPKKDLRNSKSSILLINFFPLTLVAVGPYISNNEIAKIFKFFDGFWLFYYSWFKFQKVVTEHGHTHTELYHIRLFRIQVSKIGNGTWAHREEFIGTLWGEFIGSWNTALYI